MIAWLIERKGPSGPEYFYSTQLGDGRYGFDFSVDANRAIKLATREDCEFAIAQLMEIFDQAGWECSAVEHAFGDDDG